MIVNRVINYVVGSNSNRIDSSSGNSYITQFWDICLKGAQPQSIIHKLGYVSSRLYISKYQLFRILVISGQVILGLRYLHG